MNPFNYDYPIAKMKISRERVQVIGSPFGYGSDISQGRIQCSSCSCTQSSIDLPLLAKNK